MTMLITCPHETDVLPDEPKHVLEDWTPDDWQRLLTVAATQPGSVADLPARQWWPAFLLTHWDTLAPFDDLLAVRFCDLNVMSGSLECGPHAYRLQPLTLQAFQALRDGGDAMLFPWPWEAQRAGRRLYQAFVSLVDRAGLILGAATCGPLERRLARTLRRQPGLLDGLTLPDCLNISPLAETEEFFEPSPDDIAAACAAIRATWTEAEYRARARGRSRAALLNQEDDVRAQAASPRWLPPLCRSERREPCC